jgi:TRAP-type transport system periplasmic protein
MWRNLLQAVAMSILALATAVVTPAAAQTIELKASHFLPPNHTIQKWLTAWAADLEKSSGGKVKLQIYPAGQLGGGPNRQFDSARNGVVDIAFSLHGATPRRYAMSELASLPYTHPSAGFASAIASRRLTELAAAYLAPEHQGLRILLMAVTPPLLFHSKTPIRKLEDFKGLKIRYAGVQFKNLIDAVGAVPLPVPPQETQDALAKGIIDAATFPYEGAASFDLGTVTKYALEPGVSAATFALVMNPAKYDALPDDVKQLIEKTTGPSGASAFGAMWDEAEEEGKANLVSKGVQPVVMSAEEIARIKTLVAQQIDTAIFDADKKGGNARIFYEEYTK